jgi:hypothetical protein
VQVLELELERVQELAQALERAQLEQPVPAGA